MRYVSITSVVLLVAVLVAGCSEEAVLTAASEGPELSISSPSNVGSPPASSGPYVVRSERGYAIFYVDPRTGVSAIHGVDIVEFCTSGATFDVVEFQRITLPSEVGRFIDVLRGDDLTTSVWPFPTFSCALYTTTDPLATGTVDLVLTDNDILPNGGGGNWNAFGWQTHGRLSTDSEGGTAQFSSHRRCRFIIDDVNTFRCDLKINLR